MKSQKKELAFTSDHNKKEPKRSLMAMKLCEALKTLAFLTVFLLSVCILGKGSEPAVKTAFAKSGAVYAFLYDGAAENADQLLIGDIKKLNALGARLILPGDDVKAGKLSVLMIIEGFRDAKLICDICAFGAKPVIVIDRHMNEATLDDLRELFEHNLAVPALKTECFYRLLGERAIATATNDSFYGVSNSECMLEETKRLSPYELVGTSCVVPAHNGAIYTLTAGKADNDVDAYGASGEVCRLSMLARSAGVPLEDCFCGF